MRNIFSLFLVIVLLPLVSSCDFVKKHGNNVVSKGQDSDLTSVVAPNANRPSNVENLHPDAKKFIDETLPDREIARVIVDDDEFKVWLTSGELLEFDQDGAFKEIECAAGVPEAMIDGRLLQDVKSLNSQAYIVKIEKKSDAGYEVKLNTGVEIEYDAGYSRIGIDD